MPSLDEEINWGEKTQHKQQLKPHQLVSMSVDNYGAETARFLLKSLSRVLQRVCREDLISWLSLLFLLELGAQISISLLSMTPIKETEVKFLHDDRVMWSVNLLLSSTPGSTLVESR